MNRSQLRIGRAIAVVFALALTLGFVRQASAETVHRTVVLKVKGGGTELLMAEIEAVPDLDIRDQAWFLKQVKSRGMKAQKLLTRPSDLRFVMSGSNIEYVIYVDEEDGQFTGRVFGTDGELAEEVPLGSEFGQVEAAEVRSLFEHVLGIETETVESVEVAPMAEPVAVPEETATETEVATAPRSGAPRGGLSLSAAGRVFRRDLTFSGSNNAVLNYESALYPGFGIGGRYVLDSVEVGPSMLGFTATVDGGFDSLATEDQSLSILHIDTLVALLLQFDQLDVRVGARHVRYSVAANDVFPTLVHTVVVVGLGTERQLGKLLLGGEIEAHPWGMYGSKSSTLFGSKSSVVGFAAALGIGYAMTDHLALRAGYRFRVARSSFPGQGTLDFNDSRGFELVHGPELGIGWHP